uniref:Uncharacterized protein n=1 Tax=Syphacia muris TaxID=451379 RepID=A0A0N5ASL8_9BILA
MSFFLVFVCSFTDLKPQAFRSNSEGDNEQPLDDGYTEAEIESTDTLRAGNYELFGATLLSTKFVIEKNDKELPEPILKDDLVASLPGVVPRKQCQLRLAKANSHHVITKTTGITTSSITVCDGTATPKTSATGVHSIRVHNDSTLSAAPDSMSRRSSASSQQTYILDNDIRKPLIVRDVFTATLPRLH